MKCNGFAYLPVKKVDRVQFPHRLQFKINNYGKNTSQGRVGIKPK